MKTKFFSGCSSVAIVLGLLCAPASVSAQATASDQKLSVNPAVTGNSPESATAGLEEVVVTAQRRPEKVQNIPISMTAVSGDNLVKLNVTSLDSLQHMAPGVTMSTVGSGMVTYTYIRGGGTNQLDPGSDPSVAFFVDEIYLGGTAGLQFDLFDIDHVEVLKGPQGTLFGRNASSGAISVVTKRPSSVFKADVGLEVGSYNARLARGSITGPIASDGSLLFRVSGVHRERDGFTENLTGGAKPGNIDSDGVRGQIEWRGDNLNVLLSADALKARNGQTNSFLSTPNVASFVDPTLPQPTNQSFYRHYYDLIGFENQDLHNLSGRIEWTTPIGTVTSISAYRSNKFQRLQDQDSTLYNSYSLYTNEHDKTFSQELRLAGDAIDRLHYVAGLYYYHANTAFFIRANTGPAYATAILRGRSATDESTILTDSYAAFGQVTYDITPQVGLTVGGRYTKDDKEDQRQVNRFGLLTYAVNPKASFHAFTPAVTLDYKPRDGILAYISYREGYKSGGFQTVIPASAALANTPFQPEYVASYEVGLKTTFFDRRLLANVALFRSDITDQQISRIVTLTDILIDNAGKTRAQGVDVTLSVKPVRDLTLSANATWQHARFLQYQNGAISYAGNYQLRSPNFSGYFSGEYVIPLGDFGKMTLIGGYSRKSTSFFDAANPTGPGLYQPAYGIGNLRLTLSPSGTNYEVSASIKNVGNTQYYQNVAVGGQAGLAVPGEPRTYGVSLNARF